MRDATNEAVSGMSFGDFEQHMHSITNAQCSLYTNWAGPIRVPHVAKFAQRTADRLAITRPPLGGYNDPRRVLERFVSI